MAILCAAGMHIVKMRGGVWVQNSAVAIKILLITGLIVIAVIQRPEIPTADMELDGEIWYVALGERHLPQGSPASPTVTNIICRSLDKSLSALSEKYGLKYSRYADDMSFSSTSDNWL